MCIRDRSTIVAEVYGPDYETQVKIADEVQKILINTDDVVDVDWMVETPQKEFKIVPDKEKAMLNGVASQQIVGNLNYLLGEHSIGNLFDPKSNDAVDIVMKLQDGEKTSIADLTNLKVKGAAGMVPVSDIVKVQRETLEKSIYRKDQKRVVYILADMAGAVSYTHLDVYKRQVHSMAMNGKAMIIVKFFVGEDTERSYVKLYDEMMKNKTILPKGVY